MTTFIISLPTTGLTQQLWLENIQEPMELFLN
jgi:hypothetical protein